MKNPQNIPEEAMFIMSFLSSGDAHLGFNSFLFFLTCTIVDLRAWTTKLWSAVAERSDDTAFRDRAWLPKRRGASLPAALQILWLRRKPRWVHLRSSVVLLRIAPPQFPTPTR
jgi:hypothetical protein